MTRIEAARRRAAGAKQIAVAAAAAGFLGTLLLVHGTHLGHAASSGSTSTQQAQTSVS